MEWFKTQHNKYFTLVASWLPSWNWNWKRNHFLTIFTTPIALGYGNPCASGVKCWHANSQGEHWALPTLGHLHRALSCEVQGLKSPVRALLQACSCFSIQTIISWQESRSFFHELPCTLLVVWFPKSSLLYFNLVKKVQKNLCEKAGWTCNQRPEFTLIGCCRVP